MRKHFAATILGVAALALSSCGNKTSAAAGESVKPGESTPSTTSADNTESTHPSAKLDGDFEIKVWCADAAQALTEAQLDKFKTAHPEANFDFTVEAVGEGDAAGNMVSDVEAGADLFFFAQDQLASLVAAGALSRIGGSVADVIKHDNDNSAVAAATLGDDLYAFPVTSDNGYFAYYDKSVIKDPAVLENQTDLIAAVKAAGKKIYFEGTSAWYNMAYLTAAGAHSTFTVKDKKFIAYDDTYNSAQGLIGAKGLKELVTESGVFVNSSSASTGFAGATTDKDGNPVAAGGAAVVVSGTWDLAKTQELLGDNIGCTDLWSFKVDGTDYHLRSFSGNKLIGVKPQEDAKKAAALNALALYLSGKECQTERFEQLKWGGSNRELQATDAYKSNIGLAALAEQSKYATPQGQYPNGWWNMAGAISSSIETLGAGATDEQLQGVLSTYASGLDSLIEA